MAQIRKSTVDTASHVAQLFEIRFGRSCAAVSRAPGRVNLLGEHVDYNGGFVLPAATDRATFVAFAPAGSDVCTLWAEDYEQQTRFSSRHLALKRSTDGEPLLDWAKYPAGVAWALADRGLAVEGVDAVYASEVPRGAGLSSSASVELAFAIAWMSTGGWSLPSMELARLCQRAENDYVGVNCGIMDQAASACSVEGRVMLLDCRSLEYRTFALPDGVAIVVADTGVRHTLAASAYNARRLACEQAVHILQRDLQHIATLRDVSLTDFDRLSSGLPQEVEMRARHVVEEIDRTRQAVPHLEAGDLQAFGELMNACHASLRDLYQVSCPELDTMVHIAQSLPGCYGSRLTGAGFGGCTVNLVEQERTPAFVEVLAAGYEQATRHRPEIYICAASAGASII